MRRRSLLLAALAVSCALPLVAGGAPVAEAATSVTLDGHGYGHGYGLSQWGAYGYAVDHGWSSAQILDHYYGGTVSASMPIDTRITVRLQNLDGAQTAVVSDTGTLVVDGVAGGPWRSVLTREVAPSTYRVWARSDAQVCPSSSGDPVASGWTLVADTVATKVDIRTTADQATASFAQLPAVCEPGGKIRSYRGIIRAVNDKTGANRTVNDAPIEQYLRAVIAKEMSPSWASAGGGKGAQALQAQAVAARSYALAENRDPAFKTCDLVCQYYAGAAYRSTIGGAYTQVEYPSTDAAVQAVAGLVRRVGNTGGQIAYTMFAASSGGWTMPGPGGQLPFPAVPDDGDDTALNPNHNWTVTFTGSQISAKYPAIGTFTGITIVARNGYGDWGGRVTSMRVEGTSGSVTVTGDAFKSALGLKSNWFAVRGQPSEPPIEDCGTRTPPAVTGELPTAPGAEYHAIDPLRLIDTRSGVGTSDLPLGGGCTLVIDPGLADGVTAVAVNVTAVRPLQNGYLTAYPCGTPRPNVSAVQAIGGRAVAGMAVVPLGASGTICIFSSTNTELVVDLFGWYAPDAGVPYEPMTAVRLKDTRGGAMPAAGSIVHVPVVKPGGAPAGATAAALTVHVTDASGVGYATVYPCSATVPVVSSINTVTGSSVTNHVEVSLSATGEVCVFVSTAMHVIVDLSGWYGAAATTEFFAVDPFRAVDTRDGTGLSGAFTAGSNRAVTLAGTGGLPAASTVKAVMAEVTAVAPSATGYLTVHPCLPAVPGLSMVRYTPGANFANPVASPDDASGRWCIAASAATHVLVDVSGYFA